jgi:hypothetical protein
MKTYEIGTEGTSRSGKNEFADEREKGSSARKRRHFDEGQGVSNFV